MAEAANSVKDSIKNFIFESIQIADLDDDDNLFESGIVNSLFAVQLVTFLEKYFGIEITMEDLDIENFQSINSTTSFVIQKQNT